MTSIDWMKEFEQICIEIDLRLRGGKKKSYEDAYKKLFSQDEKKPGELVELKEAILNGTGYEIASEIADVCYQSAYLGKKIFKAASGISGLLGISEDKMMEICILKYEMRKEGKNIDREKDFFKSYFSNLKFSYGKKQAAVKKIDETLEKY